MEENRTTRQFSRDTFGAFGGEDTSQGRRTRVCCTSSVCRSLLGAPCQWSSRLGQYRTVKTVAVHNTKLGWIHYTLQVFIFVYIIIWTIVMKKGYLLQEEPVGQARLTLKQPGWHMDSPLPWSPPEILPYCDKGTPAPGQLINAGSPSLPCFYKDEYFMSTAVPDGPGLLLTTRCTEYAQYQSASCAQPTTSNCNDWSKETTANYFVVQAENFTLQFDHGIFAQAAGVSMQSQDASVVDAWIEDRNGNRVDPCDDYADMTAGCPREVVHVGPPRTAPECKDNTDCTDLMPLQTILRAAGITNLDTMGDFVTTKKGKSGVQSYRYAGLTLHIMVFYDNTFSFDLSKFRYSYRVSHVAKTSYKMEEVVPVNVTSRVLLNRHGLKIVVDVTGSIGRFDAQTLLIQLVSSMGLLAVASTITGFIAGYVEDEYKDSKFEHVGSDRSEQASRQLADDLTAELFVDTGSTRGQTRSRAVSTELREALVASSPTSGLLRRDTVSNPASATGFTMRETPP